MYPYIFLQTIVENNLNKVTNNQNNNVLLIDYTDLIRAFIRTFGYGAATRFEATKISSLFISGLKSKFRKRADRANFISIKPNFWPMQFLGPAENGTNE